MLGEREGCEDKVCGVWLRGGEYLMRFFEGSECGDLFKGNDLWFFRDWDIRLFLVVF